MRRTEKFLHPLLEGEVNRVILKTFQQNPTLQTITFYPNGDVVAGFRGEKNKRI